MKLSVLVYHDNLNTELLRDKTVVVIDVFRATSVMTTLLYYGADKILIAKDKTDALLKNKQLADQQCILIGEEGMLKIDDFHLGNSPTELKEAEVKNKTIILLTTNGTKAILTSSLAKHIYIASLLNVKSVSDELCHHKDVVILLSGSHGEFSLEDGFCAGQIINYLKKSFSNDKTSIELNDLAKLLIDSQSRQKSNFHYLAKSTAYKKLKANGFEKDVHFCLQENIYNIVPRYLNQAIIL